jgi:hypothetical protein
LNGKGKSFEFEIEGKIDYDYAKDIKPRECVSRYATYLNRVAWAVP